MMQQARRWVGSNTEFREKKNKNQKDNRQIPRVLLIWFFGKALTEFVGFCRENLALGATLTRLASIIFHFQWNRLHENVMSMTNIGFSWSFVFPAFSSFASLLWSPRPFNKNARIFLEALLISQVKVSYYERKRSSNLLANSGFIIEMNFEWILKIWSFVDEI